MSSEVSPVMNPGEEESALELPPGFRFHPTDEEVITHYLTPKALNRRFSCVVVGDVDLNKIEPWDLPGKAKMGEKEWFFFCHKDRKYPTGSRTNRATASGYWKATGRDKEIYHRDGRGVIVGMKKTLVFYMGRAPRGEKTPWVMHEFRLEGKLPPHLPHAAKDEWAVCRVFNKDLAAKQPGQMAPPAGEPPTNLPDLDDILGFGMPALMDSPYAVEDLIDFKGAAAISSSGGYQVKTEPQKQQDHDYLSQLPATSNPQQAAAVLTSPSRGGEPAVPADNMSSTPFPDLDAILLGGFMDDYDPNMW